MTWWVAQSTADYANELGWRGYNDWRLPNRTELESLVKIDQSRPSIDTLVFPNVATGSPYWTSTPVSSGAFGGLATYAYSVGFQIGDSWAETLNTGLYVRVVRGGNLYGGFDSRALKPLNVEVVAANKAFDGATKAIITTCRLAGVDPAFPVTCSASNAFFSDAKVGNNKTVTAINIQLDGPNARRYTLSNTMATTTANIVKAQQAPLIISANPASITSGVTSAILNYSGGSTGGNVRYVTSSTEGLTCTITGNQLSAVGGAGTCTVTGIMAGNSNFEAVTSAPLNVSVTAGLLSGLASQGYVGTGNQVQFGAFTISGAPRKVLIRGLGPALDQYVPGALRNPQIALSLNGAPGPIVTNDDWGQADNVAEIVALRHQPRFSAESAILRTLEPGIYNVHLSGSGGSTGIGMFQVYAVEGGGNGELKGLAAQGQVGTDNQVQFGAFTITGAPRKVLIRGLGPALNGYVPGPLENPRIALSLNGAPTPLEVNDDWADADNADEIAALKHQPKNPTESAILRTLEPGVYNVHLSGSGGIEGIGMFQVYTVE